MKVSLRNFLAILLVSIAAYGCSDCNCCLVDCAPSVFFKVAVLSEADSVNLIVDGTYTLSDMNIRRMDGSDDSGLHMSMIGDPVTSSELIISDTDVPSGYFLQLSEADVDTLVFSSTFIDADCCSFHKLEGVSINGSTAVDVTDERVTIFK